MPLTTATPGAPVDLTLQFFDETTGLPADPDTLQMDVTYGSEVGFVPDVPSGGPFLYAGASSPAPDTIWRLAEGVYHIPWGVPGNALPGGYVANWTAGYGGASFLGVENFVVLGGGPGLPVPAGDVGYWTGSIDYTPAGNSTLLGSVSIPLGAVDDNGIAWLIQKLEGWDSPDVQGGAVIPKSGDHGAWPAPQFYAARDLTLTLTASAPTQALRDQARALLQQAIPVSDLALFTYDEPVPKQMLVRRDGRITETYPTLADVTFTIGLVAPDPRKYGTQAQSTGPVNVNPGGTGGFLVPFTVPFSLAAQPPSGSAAVTNEGTFETRPQITISGPITDPALINVTTGQTVSWTGLVLGAGDVLTVDFTLRQAFLNGSYRSADLGSAWWTLPAGTPGTPGTSTIQLGGTPGSGASFEVSWQPAWI